MKIRTVSLLAGAAMTLTSLTVWSLTPAGGATDSARAADAVAGAELATPEGAWSQPTLASKARFASGSTLQVDGRLGHGSLLSSRDNESYVLVNVKADA